MRFSIFITVVAALLQIHSTLAEPMVSVLTETFESVCLPSNGSKQFIKDWATQKGLTEITSDDGRRIYIGSSTEGAAWWFKNQSAIIVVAIRTTGNTCAVFTNAANPDEVHKYLDIVRKKFSDKWPQSNVVKDESRPTQLGIRRGQVITMTSPLIPREGVLVTAITNEREGGPYQASLQISFSMPSQ